MAPFVDQFTGVIEGACLQGRGVVTTPFEDVGNVDGYVEIVVSGNGIRVGDFTTEAIDSFVAVARTETSSCGCCQSPSATSTGGGTVAAC